MKKLTMEDKLALNVFHSDEEYSHIDVDLNCTDKDEINKLLIACPAECYKLIDGTFAFSHLGCLECGTCRVISHGRIVKSWNYPSDGAGVTFRQG